MKPVNHIAILCSRLDLPGGIERAVVNTANLLAGRDFRVTVLVLDQTKQTFYPLAAAVALERLPLDFGITDQGNFLTRKFRFFAHLFLLRNKLRQLAVDCVVASEYPFSVAAFFAATRLKASVLAWEHHHFYGLRRNRFWQALFSFVYPKLHRVVCLNLAEEKLFRGMGCKTAVIPNFVSRHAQAKLDEKQLLTIGWLSTLKGVDLIPDIAEKLAAKHPDWHWTIIGSGPEENRLQAELIKRKLTAVVSVRKPETHDLAPIYQNAALYVLLSRVECFPMVLLEAASYGVPAVAFNCPTGPAAILQEGRNGVLVAKENVDAMVQAIDRLLTHADERKTLGAHAFADVERFSPETVYALWKTVLAD